MENFKDTSKPKQSRLGFYLGIAFFLFAVGLFALGKLIIIDSLREPITSALSKATGLQIEIQTLSLDLAQGLKLKCGGVSVRSPNIHRELFTAQEMLLDAELLPLLNKQIKIRKASIVQPVVRITLKKPETKTEMPSSTKPLSPATPGAGSSPGESPIDRMRSILKQAELNIQNIEIRDGLLLLTFEQGAFSKEIPVHISTQLKLLRQGPEKIDAIIKPIEAKLENILLHGDALAEDLLSPNASLNINLNLSPMALSDIHSLKPLLAPSRYESLAQLGKGKLEKLVLKIKAPLASVIDPDKLQNSAQANFNFSLKDWKTKKFEISQITGEGHWENGNLKHKTEGTLFGGGFKLDGNLDMRNVSMPTIDTHLGLEGIDWAQVKRFYMDAWTPVKGTVSGSFHIKGPLPKNSENPLSRLRIKNSIQASNISLTVPKEFNPLKMEISRLALEGTLEKNDFIHNITMDVFGGEIKERGVLRLSGNTPTQIDSTVEWKQMDLKEIKIADNKPWMPLGVKTSGTLHLKGPLPKEGKSLLDRLQATGSIEGENISLSVPENLRPLEISIPRLKAEGTLKNNRLIHKLKATLFDGEIEEQGSLDLPVQSGSPSMLETAVQWKQFNLGHLQTPAEGQWNPSSGNTSGNLKIRGPLSGDANRDGNLLTYQGTVKAERLVLGTPEPKHSIAGITLVLKESSPSKSTAQVQLKDVVLQNTPFKKIQGVLGIESYTIRLTNGLVEPKHGKILLKGTFHPPTQTYRAAFKGEGLHVEDFAPDLSGPVAFNGKLQGDLRALQEAKDRGQPMNYKHILRGMTGLASLNLTEGSIRLPESFEAILNLLNPTAIATAKKGGLNYEFLKGDFQIQKGELLTENLELKGPQLSSSAWVQANFHNDKLAGEIKVMPLEMLDTLVKAIPLLGQILTGGKKGGVIETYFDLSGTIEEPKVSLSPTKSLLQKPGRMLKGLINIPGSLNQQ